MSLRSVMGQEGAVAQLSDELRTGTVKHAYLFYGVKGIGKKFTAIQFAQALLCEAPVNGDACETCESCARIADGRHPDVLIVDYEFQAALLNEKVSEQRSMGIEAVREMQRLAALTGYHAVRKIFILDAVETMQEAGANSLLKTLEEPSGPCVFILVSAGMGNLPRTIVSRCELVSFKPLDPETLRACALAGRGNGAFPGIDEEILRSAHGSLHRLEALLQLGTERTPEALLRAPVAARYSTVDALVRTQRDTARQLVYCLAELGIRHAIRQPADQAVCIAEELLGDIGALRANIDLRILIETMIARLELPWNKN